MGAVGDVDAALICLRPVSALDRIEQDALEQAARFLSLEVAKQQAVQAIELRFASELLEMVLSGGRRAAEVPGRLQAFGVDAGGPLAVCAIAFAEGEAATLPGLADVVGEFFVTEGFRSSWRAAPRTWWRCCPGDIRKKGWCHWRSGWPGPWRGDSPAVAPWWVSAASPTTPPACENP